MKFSIKTNLKDQNVQYKLNLNFVEVISRTVIIKFLAYDKITDKTHIRFINI